MHLRRTDISRGNQHRCVFSVRHPLPPPRRSPCSGVLLLLLCKLAYSMAETQYTYSDIERHPLQADALFLTGIPAIAGEENGRLSTHVHCTAQEQHVTANCNKEFYVRAKGGRCSYPVHRYPIAYGGTSGKGTNYIKKVIKKLIFMQKMIYIHLYKVDCL